jgi:hypothetical protein
MTSATRPLSGFSSVGSRISSYGGTILTGASIGYDTYLLTNNNISVGRYTYHTRTSSLALYSAYVYGGPVGFSIGTAAFGIEYWYDNFLMWYLEELGNGLGRIEHQMKKGLYSGSGLYPRR